MSINLPAFFQVLSRNNDVNGNPYRLVLVYDGTDGSVVRAIEARSSSPDICYELEQDQLRQLPSWHLAPSTYNKTRKAYIPILEYSN
jgi:hypothetical protein